MRSRTALMAVLILGVLATPLAAQRPSTTGIPTRTIVTVLPKNKVPVPTLYREDVFVYEGNDRDGVVDWVPLRGDNAALQLVVLIDDASSRFVGNLIDDLREFISKLPASTAVGIGYLRNGTVTMAQDISPDHGRAAQALRMPAGIRGIPASNYIAIANLIAGWPEAPLRRQILFVSDGVDALFRVGANNPYVEQAVTAAQKGNVVIYSIFVRGTGFAGRSGALMTWGQGYQTQLAEGTGGQAYAMGFGSGPSITPYLDDMAKRLDHQFLLTFLAKPMKQGGPRRIKIRTEVPNAQLIAPLQVYVPAAK